MVHAKICPVTYSYIVLQRVKVQSFVSSFGCIFEGHIMLMMFSMPFHNIDYTILSLAIIPYLYYGPLMIINAPNLNTKYAGTPPPRQVLTSRTACKNSMYHVCIYAAEFFRVSQHSRSCHMGYDVIG